MVRDHDGAAADHDDVQLTPEQLAAEREEAELRAAEADSHRLG